jgi:hypothetical protein
LLSTRGDSPPVVKLRRRRQGMPPDVERSMLAHRQLGLDFVYKYKLKHAAFDLRADGAEGGSGNDTASDADDCGWGPPAGGFSSSTKGWPNVRRRPA